jgi:hypothetical protein
MTYYSVRKVQWLISIYYPLLIPSTVTSMVTFKDGNMILGTDTLNSGRVTISTKLSSGTHSITVIMSKIPISVVAPQILPARRLTCNIRRVTTNKEYWSVAE